MLHKEKILFVDDETQVLAAFERNLRRQFNVDTAHGGQTGLTAISERGPYAVIVSDMRMPGMDGVQFLATAKERAPDSVRMMLTGQADFESAAQVVNQGNIFRFLTKPCPPEVLVTALEDGLRQYGLIMAEKELLEKTLSGAIRVFSEILAMADPRSFDRSLALRELAGRLAKAMGIQGVWELNVAAMLSQLGNVTLPGAVIAKARAGQPLSNLEARLFTRVPELGYNLLSHIPRLESVARIIYYQNKRFDGHGFPDDEIKEEALPLGARILKVLTDLAQLMVDGTGLSEALASLSRRNGWYDPIVLAAARTCFLTSTDKAVASMRNTISAKVDELRLGQVLLANVETQDGTVLFTAGNILRQATLEKIRNYALLDGVKEPILVQSGPPEETS